MDERDGGEAPRVLEGRYQLGYCVGEGRYGPLWHAFDLRVARRPVTVAILREDLAQDPPLAQRFDAEVLALATVTHPNVPRLIDRGADAGARFAVIEHTVGGSLARWLEQQRARGTQCPLPVARALLDQIAGALEAAHRSPHAIVHARIEPGAVLLFEGTDGLEARVFELGLARVMPSGRASSTDLGRPAMPYLAPEQRATSPGAITPATDVFSLAVLAVELLTLDPHGPDARPFWSLTDASASQLVARLAHRRPAVPRAVWDVLAMALRPDPLDRYPHAGALRTALQRAFAQESDEARAYASSSGAISPSERPIGPAVTTRQRSSRRRGGLRSASLATLAFVAGASLSAVGMRHYARSRATSHEPVAATDAPDAEAPSVSQRDSDAVPVGDAPSTGPAHALVTVVAFADLRCPHSRRMAATLRELREHYGDDLRVVFRLTPHPGHRDARTAALAASAAHAQGRFWEMHDALFAHTAATLTPADAERIAARIGLDRDRFVRDMHGDAAARVDTDTALAQRLSVRATPTLVVNGTHVTGAQPATRLRRLIDAVLAHARRIDPPEHAYARMVSDPYEEPEEECRSRRRVTNDSRVYAIRPSEHAPSRGAPDAPVVIDHFLDLQCPFCARVEPTLVRLESEYAGLVRVRFRDFPVASHPDALSAAEAAREAFAQQGNAGYLRYRAVVLSHQSALARADLEGYARDQGLDMARFRRALAEHTHLPAIRADVDALLATGLRLGTPASFVNGRLVEGAMPFEAFRTEVDAALATWR